uniref:Cytochrome b561/ferric reductase transmembrane n=1 Tax=Tanacetum cinerariifolium TaxID=118510 RepID=A0A699H2T6_TANCI|nr:cytochrome b561/ferric reductase transmembrane [Tanacetum cinerariifolium]
MDDWSGSAKSFSNPIYGYFARTNELPKNYCMFEVNYDGVFNEYPLRYEHGKNLTLKLSKSNTMIFSKMLDMLSYKLECEIWGIFVCSPRCSLEEGFRILKGDGDMNKLKLDACSMSPHELVKWEQQEADSPYLGTLLLKPRRKADELVLDDNWQYEGLVVDDVGGSIKHCDLVHENVVYKGHSLPNMDKERFLNNVVLDDVVTDTLAYTLPKRVAIGGHGRGLGRLIGLNVDAVDDDP